jgi:hypothetical protein
LVKDVGGHQALFLKDLLPGVDGLPGDPQVEGGHLKGEKKDNCTDFPPEGSVTVGEGGAANLLEEFQKPLRPVLDGLTYIANGGFSWW